MSAIPWIMISIVVLIVLLAVVYFWINKGKKRRPVDYYSLFVIGLVWLPFGIIMKNPFFFIMALVFLGLGLVNKDKWKANRRRWKDLDKIERRAVLVITVVLMLLVFAGLVAWYLFSKGIV